MDLKEKLPKVLSQEGSNPDFQSVEASVHTRGNELTNQNTGITEGVLYPWLSFLYPPSALLSLT